MTKSALALGCVLAVLLVLPAASEAAPSEGQGKRADAQKKRVVLKAARNMPARMAIAAKAARPAVKKSRGTLVRRGAVSGNRPAHAMAPVAVKTATQAALGSAVISRPARMGDTSPNPGAGNPPIPKKTLPQRMYAADGDTFYFNGRKYRVEGVPAALANQEITKQRLQQLLDSGEVSIEPRAMDDAGLTAAVIRVAGRDVADALR